MKGLSYRSPPIVAVAENATTPTGVLGSTIWSTTANKLLVWDNTGKWAATATGGGGGGITGPGSSQNGGMVIYSNTAGSAVTQGPAVAEDSTATLTGLYVSRDAALRTFNPDPSTFPLNSSSESMLSVKTGTRYTGTPWSKSSWYARPMVQDDAFSMGAYANSALASDVSDLDGADAGFASGGVAMGSNASGLPSDFRSAEGSLTVFGSTALANDDETYGNVELTGRGDFNNLGERNSIASAAVLSDSATAGIYAQSTVAGLTSFLELGADDSPPITPTPPVEGRLRVFNRVIAGRSLLTQVGPSGLDTHLQPALFRNSIYMWLPGGGTTASIAWGTSWTIRNNGTGAAQAHPTKAATNALTSMNRATYSTGTSATGASGVHSAASVAWRGTSAGLGGFFFYSRFAVETYRADVRLLVGLSALNVALNAQPSTINNSCGLCKDSGDTTWHYFTRSATGLTKVDTGLTIAAGTILDLLMFAPPNGSSITIRVVNSVTGAVVVDNVVVETNLPVANVWMFANAHIQSTTGTTAALLALNRMYIECDL